MDVILLVTSQGLSQDFINACPNSISKMSLFWRLAVILARQAGSKPGFPKCLSKTAIPKTHPDLAMYLLQIIKTTSFNSIFC